jgi:hypothetical protein
MGDERAGHQILSHYVWTVKAAITSGGWDGGTNTRRLPFAGLEHSLSLPPRRTKDSRQQGRESFASALGAQSHQVVQWLPKGNEAQQWLSTGSTNRIIILVNTHQSNATELLRHSRFTLQSHCKAQAIGQIRQRASTPEPAAERNALWLSAS